MDSAREKKVFTLLVEMRCNSFCIFCGQRQVDEGVVKARRSLGLATPATDIGDLRGRFTLETAIATLETAQREGYEELSLQGGEPTLFPELPALVRAAKGMGFAFVGLVTNGRRLKDLELTRALLEAGLDGITVSVLGHDAKTHDALAIAPGSFDELALGLRNAARLIAERPVRAASLNVNLITSKDTTPHLAKQVTELHDAGAQAMSVHLVRFDGLASDPLVKRALAFDIRALTPALDAAWALADRVGATLHATDVPICLHPELRPAELELCERRAAVGQHGYGAASFAYEVPPTGQNHEIACDACLLRRVCPRVPGEYVLSAPSDVLRPVTEASLAEGVRTLLRELDPAAPTSAARLADRKWALGSLGRLAGDEADLAGSMALLDDGLTDLAWLAFLRGDLASVVRAFAGRLGVRAPRWSEEEVRQWASADARELALAVHAVRADREASAPRLRLAAGFDVAFELDGPPDSAPREGEEVRVTDARPVHRRAHSRGDRLFLALFLGGLSTAFRGARRVRIASRAIDVDRGEGWERALWLDGASTAQWVRGDEGG
jgi:organic radical activating enzyme